MSTAETVLIVFAVYTVVFVAHRASQAIERRNPAPCDDRGAAPAGDHATAEA